MSTSKNGTGNEVIAMRKEKIIDMLNCNQSKKVQDLGIKYALQEKEKSFLLYYAEDIQYSDNCAKIFASMSYNESEIYMDELFKDLNTPGAIIILEYLTNCPGKILYSAFKKSLTASFKRNTKTLFNNLLLIFKENATLQNVIKNNDEYAYKLLTESLL